jgi:hypothetical protein
MNRLEAITLTMAAAAAAFFRPNAGYRQRPEGEAYLALRQLLAQKYPTVPNDILNIGPASVARQTILKTQLKQAGADKDTAVLNQTKKLIQLLLEYDPKSATAVFAEPADLQTALLTL